MQDIDNLLKYFVENEIINIEDSEKIRNISVTSNKVEIILLKIQGPLESGDPQEFYKMLRIMEEHGVQATKDLAVDLKKSLGIQSKFVVLYIASYNY